MRVALTGGIASGKSTVSALLVEHGAVLIDGDRLAREVVALGTPGLAAIAEQFGEGVLLNSGELDRPAMGALVFADDTARKRLEAIVHPLIRDRAVQLEAAAPPGALIVHDIPLLAETGNPADFDAAIVVEAPEDVQIQRMVEQRGMSEPDARARIAAQATPEQRRAIATHLIGNTGTRADLRARVAQIYAELTAAPA